MPLHPDDGNLAALAAYERATDARTAVLDARKQRLLTDGLGDLIADVVSDCPDRVGEIIELLVEGTYGPAKAAAAFTALVESIADERAEDEQADWEDNEACDREWEAQRETEAA